jgi:hypothetical protein
LSWSQAAREIGVSASTLTGLRRRNAIEGDGVLQMLLWLDRTPESFVRNSAGAATACLPRVGSGEVLRFDAAAIHAAVDAQRRARHLTWPQVAAAIGGVSTSMLMNLANGGRVGVPAIVGVIGWLEQPVARFTRASKT